MNQLLPFLVDITAALALLYGSLVVYLWLGWKRLPNPWTTCAAPTTRISVLIAARNEAHQIGHTIQDILGQDYPEDLIELIVIDDHSTDGTADVVAGFAGQNVKLIRWMESKPLNSYKKKEEFSNKKSNYYEIFV